RDEKRMLAAPYRSWNYVGPGQNLGRFAASPAAQDGVGPSGWMMPYARPQDFDPKLVTADFQLHPQYYAENQPYGIQQANLNSRYFDEKVYAGSLEGNIAADDLNLRAGLRWERTLDSAVGAINNAAMAARLADSVQAAYAQYGSRIHTESGYEDF